MIFFSDSDDYPVAPESGDATSPQDRRIPIISAGLSDQGRVRRRNEDTFRIFEELNLFIVSDGMGGHPGGDTASELVVTALPVALEKHISLQTDDEEITIQSALYEAVREVCDLVHRKSDESLEFSGMGATLVACFIHGRTAHLAHMGDSRAYLLRKAALERLTHDHTIPSLLLQMGRISREEALNHPAHHLLTRHVGMSDCAWPDLAILDLEEGDRILLCSDGLTNMVSEREIGQTLLSSSTPGAACESLIEMANQAGGQDNITAMVIQFGEWEQRPHSRKKKVSIRLRVGSSMRCTRGNEDVI